MPPITMQAASVAAAIVAAFALSRAGVSGPLLWLGLPPLVVLATFTAQRLRRKRAAHDQESD
jgi:cyanate permease